MAVGTTQIQADIKALNNVSGVSGITLTYIPSICRVVNCNLVNLQGLVSNRKT